MRWVTSGSKSTALHERGNAKRLLPSGYFITQHQLVAQG